MILSDKVTSSVLNFGNKTQNIGRPVVAMIKACNKGKGSEKREEANLRPLWLYYSNVTTRFELLLNKIGNQRLRKRFERGGKSVLFICELCWVRNGTSG